MLRYYQQEAVEAVRKEWESVQSTAVIAATGAGKTEMYLDVALNESGRTLVLAHRDFLLRQPIDRLARTSFRDVAVEKADEKADVGIRRAKVVFASVQSIGPKAREDRLESLDPETFSCVIVDEAHRSTSQSYRRVLDHFKRNPRLKVLIVTATPKRKDGVALGNVCDSVAYTYGPSRAMAEGWIVAMKFFRRDVHGLDFSHVRMKGADLDPDQVQSALLQEKPLHEICASMADMKGRNLVFVPAIALGHAYVELLNQRYRPNCARMVTQDTPDAQRELFGKQLANGELQFLVNQAIYVEGYDLPQLDRVVWAAPTASLVRYTQGVGRAFRPHPEVLGELYGGLDESDRRREAIANSQKPYGEVVTFYPQNCRHQMCDPVDILGGDDLPADVSEMAKRIQEETSQNGGSDTEEDVETAKVMLDFASVLDERLKHLKAQARYTDHEFDPMSGRSNEKGSRPASDGGNSQLAIAASWGKGESATEKQRKWLSWKRVPVEIADRMTKWRSSVVRDLFELGVSLPTALHYKRGQALAVRDSLRNKAEASSRA